MQMAGNIHDQLRKFAVIMQYPRHICKQANYAYYGHHVSALSAVAMHYRLHYASLTMPMVTVMVTVTGEPLHLNNTNVSTKKIFI